MAHGTGNGDSGKDLRRLIEMDKSILPPDGGDRFNRLIFAASPYLLQHAENPVDWYPWGDDAFAEAERTNKPLLVSIGYATCHWCHVMAHESFEDTEVAEVLNRHFIAIKVDREERPDIDECYMTVSRLMTGSGGWPLNVFLTPDRKPFLSTTYVPRNRRGGMPGFIELLENIAALWRTQPERVERNCTQIVAELSRVVSASPGELPKAILREEGARQLAAMYDGEWGGFGSAPKFPMPVYLAFLLRSWKKAHDPTALGMVTHTLRKMRQGGIYDQLGFGFHRYSVDRHWLVPHFEKMLYDQGLLATAYLEAFQATGETLFRIVAEEIFIFVLRELTSPDGGFYSALDADSEGAEGTYYLWTPAEIRDMLGEQEAERVCRAYGITDLGNFEGKNILTVADATGSRPDWLEQARARLLAARERRIRPLRDEKVLTAWNGLMIAAFARGFMVTGNVAYRRAAENAVRFVLARLQGPGGRLLRSYHHGVAGVPAFLEDYACFIAGLIELHQATLNRSHLDEALRLAREMLRLFGDGERGGLYDTGSDVEAVLVRTKSADDGVTPSSNSMAAMSLARLGRIAQEEDLVAGAELIARAFGGSIARQPAAYLWLVAAHDFLTNPPVEIELVGEADSPEAMAMVRAAGVRFIPNLALRLEMPREGKNRMVEGKTTAYVCAAGACRPPVTGPEQLGKLLDEVA